MRYLFLVLFLSAFHFAQADFTRDEQVTSKCYELWYNDTTVNLPTVKYHRTYNNDNDLIEEVTMNFVGGVWENTTRRTYTYDGSHNKVISLSENWISGSWQNDILDSALFNTGNKLLMSAQYKWSTGWIPDAERHVIQYSASDSLMTDLLFVPAGSVWVNRSLKTHFRNAGEKDSLNLQQVWNGSSWTDSVRVLFQKNLSGTDTIVLTQLWGGSAWNNFYRNVYSLDAQQRILNDTLQYYGAGVWMNNHLTQTTYDQYGYGYSILYQNWNPGLNAFENDHRIYYGYDLHRRLASKSESTDWDPQGNFTFSYYSNYDTSGHVLSTSVSCVGCSGSGTSYTYNNSGYLIKVLSWHFNHGGDYYEDVCDYYYTALNGATFICDSGSTTIYADTAQSYLWSDGETTQQISVSQTGYYQVTLTYPDGVSLQTPFTLVELIPANPIPDSPDSLVYVCNKSNIRLAVPYYENMTYTWYRNDTLLSNNYYTDTAYVLTWYNSRQGAYKCIMTGPCGSDTSAITNVHMAIAPSASITPNVTSFCTGDTLLLTALPAGAASYWWYQGDTTQSIEVTTAGTYAVRVFDTTGCYSMSSVNLQTVQAAPIPSIVQNGNNLIASPNGLYLIQWFLNGVAIPGATSIIYTPLQDGNYTVVYSKANGCSAESATSPYSIGTFIAEAGANQHLCQGSHLSLGMGSNTGYGGTAPYHFDWTPGTWLNDSTIASPIATPPVSTTYYLTVTDSLGNTAVDSISIIVDSLPDVTITSTLGMFDICSNVSARWTAPFRSENTYAWRYNGAYSSAQNQIYVYQTGTYSLTVTNTLTGCVDTSGSIVVHQLPGINPLQIYVTGEPVACGGTGVELYVQSDSGYTYQWYDNYGNLLVGETDTSFYPTIPGFNGYTLVATAPNLCYSRSYSPYLETDSTLVLEPITASDSNFCRVSAIDLFANVVTGYSYQWYWNAFDIPGADSSFYQTTWPGTYFVECTDTNGCKGRIGIDVYPIFPPDSMTIQPYGSALLASGNHSTLQWYLNGNPIPNTSDTIYHPTEPGVYTVLNISNSSGGFCSTMSAPYIISCAVSWQKTGLPCDHSCVGEIDLNINGGVNPQISWSNGAADSLISSLCLGNYYFTVDDGAACHVSDSIYIGDANPVTLYTYTTDLQCYNDCIGAISLSAEGGTWQYTWQLNGIDTLANINNLCAGTYLVKVIDDAGCTDSATIVFQNPAPITFTNQIYRQPSCSGVCDGAVEIFADSPYGIHNVFWNDISGYFDRYDLCDTTYIATIWDNNNCSIKDTISLIALDTLQLSVSVVPASCAITCDAILSATANSGTAPYTYSWSNGQTGSSILACQGPITIVVSDSAGCTLSQSFVVAAPDTLILATNASGTNCIGCSDGEIALTSSGGTLPVSYSIQPIAGVIQNDTIKNLPAGHYWVCVVDVNGCSYCDSVIVLEDPTSVSELNNQGNFDLAPNPFHNSTTIRYFGNPGIVFDIIVTDVSGRVVEKLTSQKMPVVISGHDLVSGMYFVTVQEQNKLRWKTKIVVVD